MPSIPSDQRNRLAHFLEKQGFKQQALVVSTDPEHRFELALALHKLITARDIAFELETPQKWKQLAEVCINNTSRHLIPIRSCFPLLMQRIFAF